MRPATDKVNSSYNCRNGRLGVAFVKEVASNRQALPVAILTRCELLCCVRNERCVDCPLSADSPHRDLHWIKTLTCVMIPNVSNRIARLVLFCFLFGTISTRNTSKLGESLLTMVHSY